MPEAAEANTAKGVIGISSKSTISDDQKSQLQNIFKKYEEIVTPLMQQYEAEKTALSQLINAEKFDETAIRAQFAKAAKIGAEVTITNAKLRQEMRSVLTKEQLANIKQVGGEIAEANIDRMLFRLATPVKP
jgi:Spy/CpxP family protein refolding chaperone